MKYVYWWLGFLLLGSAGLVIIVMFETITLNNDSEYYVLKEAMEAAMLESVDVTCFRLTTVVNENGCNGQLKISEQKFVENFTRRFAESISDDADSYTINFYDIIESPPKASVVIKSSNKEFNLVTDSVDIANGLSGILETGWGEYVLNIEDGTSSVGLPADFGDVPSGSASDLDVGDFSGDIYSDVQPEEEGEVGFDGNGEGRDSNATIPDEVPEDEAKEENSEPDDKESDKDDEGNTANGANDILNRWER